MARFLFRAQDHNMTNGDYAFFTFRAVRSHLTDRPWLQYAIDPDDLPRRLQAFTVVKQVRTISLLFLQRGCIACNAERCNTYSNSVCPSVTRWYPIQTNEHRITRCTL